jgi:hypothetical protein
MYAAREKMSTRARPARHDPTIINTVPSGKEDVWRYGLPSFCGMTTWYVGIPCVFCVSLGSPVARLGSFAEVVRPGRLAFEVVKRLGRVFDSLEVLAVVFVSEVVLVGVCEAFVLSSSPPVAVGWGESWVVVWGACDVDVVVSAFAAFPLPAALTPWPANRKANRNASNEGPSFPLRLPKRKISGRIIISNRRHKPLNLNECIAEVGRRRWAGQVVLALRH